MPNRLTPLPSLLPGASVPIGQKRSVWCERRFVRKSVEMRDAGTRVSDAELRPAELGLDSGAWIWRDDVLK